MMRRLSVQLNDFFPKKSMHFHTFAYKFYSYTMLVPILVLNVKKGE